MAPNPAAVRPTSVTTLPKAAELLFRLAMRSPVPLTRSLICVPCLARSRITPDRWVTIDPITWSRLAMSLASVLICATVLVNDTWSPWKTAINPWDRPLICSEVNVSNSGWKPASSRVTSNESSDGCRRRDPGPSGVRG